MCCVAVPSVWVRRGGEGKHKLFLCVPPLDLTPIVAMSAIDTEQLSSRQWMVAAEHELTLRSATTEQDVSPQLVDAFREAYAFPQLDALAILKWYQSLLPSHHRLLKTLRKQIAAHHEADEEKNVRLSNARVLLASLNEIVSELGGPSTTQCDHPAVPFTTAPPKPVPSVQSTAQEMDEKRKSLPNEASDSIPQHRKKTTKKTLRKGGKKRQRQSTELEEEATNEPATHEEATNEDGPQCQEEDHETPIGDDAAVDEPGARACWKCGDDVGDLLYCVHCKRLFHEDCGGPHPDVPAATRLCRKCREDLGTASSNDGMEETSGDEDDSSTSTSLGGFIVPDEPNEASDGNSDDVVAFEPPF